jgi:hypothetical protein
VVLIGEELTTHHVANSQILRGSVVSLPICQKVRPFLTAALPPDASPRRERSTD